MVALCAIEGHGHNNATGPVAHLRDAASLNIVLVSVLHLASKLISVSLPCTYSFSRAQTASRSCRPLRRRKEGTVRVHYKNVVLA